MEILETIFCANETVEEVERGEEIDREDEDGRSDATEIGSRIKPSILCGVCCSVAVGLRKGIEEDAGENDEHREMECDLSKGLKDFEITKQFWSVSERN